MAYKKIKFFENETALSKTSSGYGLPFGAKDHTLQVVIDGDNLFSVSVKLEGSLDNKNWFTIMEFTDKTSGVKFESNKFVDIIRVSYEIKLEETLELDENPMILDETVAQLLHDGGGEPTFNSISIYYLGT